MRVGKRTPAVICGGTKTKEYRFYAANGSGFVPWVNSGLRSCCFSGIGAWDFMIPPNIRNALDCEPNAVEVKAASTVLMREMQPLHSTSNTPSFYKLCWMNYFFSDTKSGFGCVDRINLKSLDVSEGLASEKSKVDLVGLIKGYPPVLLCDSNAAQFEPLKELEKAYESGTNLLLSQYSRGIEASECAVYIVSTNGHLFKFSCMTLLEPLFPNLVCLSGVLDVSMLSQKKQICALLAKVKRAVLEQAKHIQTKSNAEKVRGAMEMKFGTKSFGLSEEKYHRKTGSSVAIGWYHFMETFDKVWKSEELRTHVVFPLGFLKSQTGHVEGVLFPKLSDQWKIGLPVDVNQHMLYCEELLRLVKLMHKVDVVYMDLLPFKIAWNYVDNSMQLRLLDFGAAMAVGQEIEREECDCCDDDEKDYRWPLSPVPRAVHVNMDLWLCHRIALVDERVSFPCSAWWKVDQIIAGFNKSIEEDEDDKNAKFLNWLTSKNQTI